MPQLEKILDTREWNALADSAERETRTLPEQARHLIREGLARRGQLGQTDERPEPSPQEAA